ncbi:uncharacterized protein LOC128332759 [Hemicordylus capensis]|uniref:uncharacterized protein LOC128332759 n=1 Tax=Hemicordylus capensis TaxID=884348 RepID=UPI0023032416|nr:uncharacterized protein LOC128332759 [Hemicordylus capensis]
MAERALLNLNPAGLLRGGAQWVLEALLSCIIPKVKRFLIFLLVTVVIAVVVSVVLSTAVWLTMDKVEDLSMNSESGIILPSKQWWKPHNAMKILKDVLLYIAMILPSDEPLTVRNLLRHRDRLGGMNYMLRACFDKAIDVFNQEPTVVQQNAKMIIQCEGQAVEFLSGNGDCEISVYLLNEKIQYTIQELTAEMYLARLSVRQEPLSVGDLLRVRWELQSLKVLSEELGGCLELAVENFAEEPSCVQSSAYMVVDCGGLVLKFASGRGENHINVYDVQDGRMHYRIKAAGLWASTVRFFRGNKEHMESRPRKVLQLE